MLFENTLAAGLLGAYVQATSGGALYRNTTFLHDSLGKRVLAKHLDILEDPHVRNGKGSSPFDDEGVRTLCYPGDARHSVTQRAMRGPTRLRFVAGRFEPAGGFEEFL